MSATRFLQTEDFAASRAAEAWCAEHGYSVGRMQHSDPRGILKGDYDIAKWRNLNARERKALDGHMVGDMRHGPVTVTIFERGAQ